MNAQITTVEERDELLPLTIIRDFLGRICVLYESKNNGSQWLTPDSIHG